METQLRGDRHADTKPDRQTHCQRDRHIDKETEGQTDR